MAGMSEHRGLRKEPPERRVAELLIKAQEETSVRIGRIMATFVGAALFCLLSLLSPDSSLLTNDERLTIPVAGPVSLLGFIIVGPALLIALRIYLQIYVEHFRRLERIVRSR